MHLGVCECACDGRGTSMFNLKLTLAIVPTFLSHFFGVLGDCQAVFKYPFYHL